jgi:hypothetical protein
LMNGITCQTYQYTNITVLRHDSKLQQCIFDDSMMVTTYVCPNLLSLLGTRQVIMLTLSIRSAGGLPLMLPVYWSRIKNLSRMAIWKEERYTYAAV